MNGRRKVAALGGLWLAVTVAMLAAPGCYGQHCEGTTGTYGNKPGEGNMIDENTWETTAIDCKWLHFSSRHSWFFDVPAFGDRKPYLVVPMISPIEEPMVYGADKPIGNATIGGGNLTEITGIDRNRFNVTNGTCAEYFIRVVAFLPPKGDPVAPIVEVDASADASDAGADSAGTADSGADADAGDASTD